MTNDLIADLRTAIEAHQSPEIMTPAQAVEFLGVSDHYLLDLRKRKSGPAYSQPASKIVRYMHDDLIAWMNKHRVVSTLKKEGQV